MQVTDRCTDLSLPEDFLLPPVTWQQRGNSGTGMGMKRPLETQTLSPLTLYRSKEFYYHLWGIIERWAESPPYWNMSVLEYHYVETLYFGTMLDYTVFEYTTLTVLSTSYWTIMLGQGT